MAQAPHPLGSSPTSAAETADGDSLSLRMNLLRVAWLSIAFGLLLELLLVAAGAGITPGLDLSAASILRSATWSFLVCMGVAVGMAIAKGRALIAGMGGLFAAPIAFIAARAVQKATQDLTAGAASAASSPILSTTLYPAVVRGVEYLCLGAVLAWLADEQHHKRGFVAYGVAGFGIGAIFGGLITLLAPAASLLSWVLNELVFPVGCSLIIFASEALGKHIPDAHKA